MRVLDLAKELNTTSEVILSKLKAFKLKAKDSDQELNTAVISVLRRELDKEGKIISSAKLSLMEKKPSPESAAAKEAKTKIKPDEKGKDKVESKIKTAQELLTPSAQIEDPQKDKARGTKSTSRKKSVSDLSPQTSVLEVETPPKIFLQESKDTPMPVKFKTKFSSEPFVSVKPLPKRKKKMSGPGLTKGPAAEPAKGHKDFERKDVPSALGTPSTHKEPSAAILEKEKITSVTDPLVSVETSSEAAALLPALEMKIPIAVKDLAVKLQQKQGIVLKKLMQIGIFANINQNLNEEIVKSVAASFGYSIIKSKTQEEHLIEIHKTQDEDTDLLKVRAPVVTFMGHVDHGKTSLLDKIRKTKIADKEHGGITQHIGAYSVNHSKGKITFLDTPGHEAFTAMRARGAHITDLVVLVVAADEGLMPQTLEAVDHARAAKVPIVVALNKIDKPNADPERIKKQLADHDLLPEDWGGKTIVVGVSALTGEGIDNLLEMILLESELLELKANFEKKASGIVVDAHMSHGKGALATVIVQNGILREGDIIVTGALFGKIRAMFDDLEKPVKEAGPSTATEILGLPGVPEAGDMFYVVENEKIAREITVQKQEQIKMNKQQLFSKITLEDLYAQVKEGKIKELNVIMKADVQGSLEALIDSLGKIPSEEVHLKFIHTAVGDINASDVILADASNAIIIGFQVAVDSRAKQALENHPVDVRTYRIIYDAVNDVRNALEGLLEPKTKKKFLSRVEVRQVFNLSKSGIVAGSFVQKGKMLRKAHVDVIRNGEVVFTGTIASLKRFKDDVREVPEGMECGISINNYDKIEPGDILEAFELEKIARKL